MVGDLTVPDTRAQVALDLILGVHLGLMGTAMKASSQGSRRLSTPRSVYAYEKKCKEGRISIIGWLLP